MPSTRRTNCCGDNTASWIGIGRSLIESHLGGRDPSVTGLVMDPMLATRGSAVGAIRALQQWGVADIWMLAVIAVPAEIECFQQNCPDVQLFCFAGD